jgi:3-deoxy-D-manno-octulosonic-acid transferase
MAKLIVDLDVFVSLGQKVIKNRGNLKAGNLIGKEQGYEQDDTKNYISPPDAEFSKPFHNLSPINLF